MSGAARALSPERFAGDLDKSDGRIRGPTQGRCDDGAMTVAAESKGQERVTFSRGYGVCIMGIDGTWRRDCLLNAISDSDALLTVEGSIQGLNLTEFFLLLSSTGLAYRRCELVRVNGAEIEVQFLLGKNKKKGPDTSSTQDALMGG